MRFQRFIVVVLVALSHPGGACSPVPKQISGMSFLWHPSWCFARGHDVAFGCVREKFGVRSCGLVVALTQVSGRHLRQLAPRHADAPHLKMLSHATGHKVHTRVL